MTIREGRGIETATGLMPLAMMMNIIVGRT